MTEGKFGEPWDINDTGPGGKFMVSKKWYRMRYIREGHLKRAILCTNALAGIDDPAAFMQAVKELQAAAKAFCEEEPICASEGQRVAFRNMERSLAKLEEII